MDNDLQKPSQDDRSELDNVVSAEETVETPEESSAEAEVEAEAGTGELAEVEESIEQAALPVEEIEEEIEEKTDEEPTAEALTAASLAQKWPGQWYVLHTYSGYEDAVSESLKQRISSLDMQDKIFDVLVPKENQIEIKNGKRKIVEKKMFPGYVLVNMNVTEDSWYVVRNTPNVTGFIGSGTVPVPVAEHELKGIFKRMDVEEPKYKIDVNIGDLVHIKDGPFKNYDGSVAEIDEEKGKIKVLVSIFGRETPVELDFLQIKKA
jgi:transcriptional antiterminator NusG